MRRAWLLCLVCCAVLATGAAGMYVPGSPSPTDRIIPLSGQFVVQFADGVHLNTLARGGSAARLGVFSLDRILERFQADQIRSLAPDKVGSDEPLGRLCVVTLKPGQDDQAFLEAMTADPSVTAITQDFACRVAATPNDPSHSSQWAYRAGSQLLVHEAWDIEMGSDAVVVAIMDTGVNYRHGDLKGAMWVNPGEDIDGDQVVFDSTDFNAVDNGGNGYTDDVVGYDFVQSSAGLVPWPGEDAAAKDNDPNDFNGHGTACAGVAGAVTNNSTGVAGLAGGWGPAWSGRGVRIMALRVGLSAQDPGDPSVEGGFAIMSAVVEAINYAVANGADVINFSAGSSNVSGMPAALNAAMSAGIVFCVAAGNDNSQTADYFGSYPGILAVAATNESDYKSGYSNYGTWVEVSAPGDGIYSTNSSHYSPGYTTWSGTSFSSPMTAGLAALIKSHYPNFTKTEIDTIIKNHTDNIDAINPSFVGKLGTGRINAYNCLANAPVANFTGAPLWGPSPLTVAFTDQSPAATSWDWDFGDGGSSVDQNPGYTYNNPGLYTVSLTVTDPNGTDTQIRSNQVLVTADTLWAPTVICGSGDTLRVPIYLTNSLPLDEFDLAFIFPNSGSPTLSYKGYTRIGTRSELFDTVQVKAQSSTKIALRLIPALTTGRNAMPAGSGPVIILKFLATRTGTGAIDTTTINGITLTLKNHFYEYKPVVLPIAFGVGIRGDANGDGSIDVGDAVHIVNYIFKGGLPPGTYEGDANGDGTINVGDSVYIINYIFKGGPPPPP